MKSLLSITALIACLAAPAFAAPGTTGSAGADGLRGGVSSSRPMPRPANFAQQVRARTLAGMSAGGRFRASGGGYTGQHPGATYDSDGHMTGRAK